MACNFVFFKCMVEFTDVAIWSKTFIGKFLIIKSISYYRSVEIVLLPNSVKSIATVWMMSVSSVVLLAVVEPFRAELTGESLGHDGTLASSFLSFAS